MSSWIAAAAPWLRGSLVVSFLLGRNLKYVLPVLRGSDICDSLIHVSCTRPGLTVISLSEDHVERMDRHIILVFTQKTEWRIGQSSGIRYSLSMRQGIQGKSSRGPIFFEGWLPNRRIIQDGHTLGTPWWSIYLGETMTMVSISHVSHQYCSPQSR